MRSGGLQVETAKAAAKRIYQKINYGGGPLQSYELSALLTDTYEYLKIPFKPSAKDLKGYAQVLDADRDGEVTLGDFQTMAVQYLCGNGVLDEPKRDYGFKKERVDVQPLPSYKPTPSFSTNPASYTSVPASVSTVPTRVEPPSKPVSTKSIKPLGSSKKIPIGLGPTGQRSYSDKTLEYLGITKKIFNKYADSNQTITAKEVPDLLGETYETLGRKGYRPNGEDVKVWMKLCDSNSDGHVEYDQYEYFVVRSMERSGFQVYK